jgi:hypothetical protein
MVWISIPIQFKLKWNWKISIKSGHFSWNLIK